VYNSLTKKQIFFFKKKDGVQIKMRLKRSHIGLESIKIERNSVTLLEIKKTDVLRYVRSQFSQRTQFPQLKIETFLPQAQNFLQYIKSLTNLRIINFQRLIDEFL
jgi:hypothetical protein